MGSDNTELKKKVAIEALNYVPEGRVIGIGTGSTVNCFIEELARIKEQVPEVVSSSKQTEELLIKHGFIVKDLNSVDRVYAYFDGADAFNRVKELVKGGGGALTREKILASASDRFICLVDETKGPQVLGKFPVPIEVIPMARSKVAREIVKLGGQPELRENFTTDNGNIIIDVRNWEINEPIALEEKLNAIPGVVENGIFGHHCADVILVAKSSGKVEVL